MSTSTPVNNAKVKIEPREAGRAPPKKHQNDEKGHERRGSGENDGQKGEKKESGGRKDESDSHLETWVEFVKRTRT